MCYKKGSDYEDKLSHLRFLVWLGIVMGISSFLLFPWSESGVPFGALVLKYNGTSVTVDISVTFSPDTRFEAISWFQKELQEELSREIENCRVAVVIDGFNEKSDR